MDIKEIKYAGAIKDLSDICEKEGCRLVGVSIEGLGSPFEIMGIPISAVTVEEMATLGGQKIPMTIKKTLGRCV